MSATHAEGDALSTIVSSQPLPGEYETWTGAEKQAEIVRRLEATQYRDGLPELKGFSPLRFAQLAIDLTGNFLKKTFARVADDMPEKREKIIHARGSAAAVQFEADPRSPFTGLFRGAPGLVRFSLAVAPSESFAYTPGLGLKLFVDGRPSENLVAMYSLDGQGADQNFFANEFSNVIGHPNSAPLKILESFFQRAVRNATEIEVGAMSRVNGDGSAVANPVQPCQLWFAPSKEVNGLIPSDTTEDFREHMARIPTGTTIYDVYGSEDCDIATRVPMGKLKSTSTFYASLYGDEGVYFKHEERK